MMRLTLFLLMVISMLISFPVQGGGRAWHQHAHRDGHHYQHNGGHYVLHHGRFVCRNRHHNHYRGQTQFYTVPNVAAGTRYGYSASGAVIVFQPYHPGRHRH
jgi:hypothetical protein